jgi:hypothetical protein
LGVPIPPPTQIWEVTLSLQGTLDTFALPDVLRLLASTAKTGRLHVEGDRASGDVWLDAGHVVAAHADVSGPGAPLVETTFELLRCADGAFAFDADMTTSDAGAPAEVAPLLEESERLLAEWRDIEAVVPSMQAWVHMAAELGQPKAWVTADQWRLLVAIGGGSRVAALADTLGLRELPVCRAVKDLVEAGLATVDGAEREAAVQPEAAAVEQRVPRAVRRPKAAAVPSPDAMDELAALAEASKVDAPELARQLSQLGPEAARAVAAAAQATTPEEREAALASLEGDTDGQGINRGLLLKFLSSVRS